MPDTLKPLPQEFFINPRYPLGAVPVKVAVAPRVVTSEAVEPSSTIEVEVGDKLDSLTRVAKEREEPGVSGGS